METNKVLLVVSLAVNLSLVVYFFPPIALMWFLKKRRKQGKIALAIFHCYKKRPNLLRKLFNDCFFSVALFVFGIYLLVEQKTHKIPFKRFADEKLQTAIAVQIGNRLFRLLRPLVPTPELNQGFSCRCYGLLTVFSLLIILTTEENNIFALLSLLFEGSVIWSDISRAEKQWNGEAPASLLHVILLLGNLFATLLIRLICPTVLVAVSVYNSNILKMSYIALALLILDIIFYYSLSILELYLVYKSLHAVRNARREAPEENGTELARMTTINNNNIFPSVTTSLMALNNGNNMESQNILPGLVSCVPQILHQNRLHESPRGHVNGEIIRNF